MSMWRVIQGMVYYSFAHSEVPFVFGIVCVIKMIKGGFGNKNVNIC